MAVHPVSDREAHFISEALTLIDTGELDLPSIYQELQSRWEDAWSYWKPDLILCLSLRYQMACEHRRRGLAPFHRRLIRMHPERKHRGGIARTEPE